MFITIARNFPKFGFRFIPRKTNLGILRSMQHAHGVQTNSTVLQNFTTVFVTVWSSSQHISSLSFFTFAKKGAADANLIYKCHLPGSGSITEVDRFAGPEPTQDICRKKLCIVRYPARVSTPPLSLNRFL